MIDIVVPQGNEEAFIVMAEKLGYTSLGFAYDEKKFQKKSKELAQLKSSITCISYVLLSTISSKKVKDHSIVQVSPETNLRTVIQQMRPEYITSLEFKKHDFIHHRSGLNQVLGTLMKQYNVKLAFNLHFLFSTKYKAEVLGRMKHNLHIAKKYAVEVLPFSFAKEPYNMKSPKEVQSLMRILH